MRLKDKFKKQMEELAKSPAPAKSVEVTEPVKEAAAVKPAEIVETKPQLFKDLEATTVTEARVNASKNVPDLIDKHPIIDLDNKRHAKALELMRDRDPTFYKKIINWD